MSDTLPIVRLAGRQSTFDPSFVKWGRKMARLGATDVDLANAFGVTEVTIHTWRKTYPEFAIALKEGKELSDANVANRLYNRAMGYHGKATKVVTDKDGNAYTFEYTEYYPPDTTACIFWLKNRKSSLWRDKHEHEHTGKDGGPIDLTLSPGEAYRRLKDG